eukprot:GFYU01006994.1.p1 GENE.GFYU01006994.1~~GFYU01006994.1.p1  ORF type:complete len:426 (-),score=90.30 GFYU01006994.1:328-1512(-)
MFKAAIALEQQAVKTAWAVEEEALVTAKTVYRFARIVVETYVRVWVNIITFVITAIISPCATFKRIAKAFGFIWPSNYMTKEYLIALETSLIESYVGTEVPVSINSTEIGGHLLRDIQIGNDPNKPYAVLLHGFGSGALVYCPSLKKLSQTHNLLIMDLVSSTINQETMPSFDTPALEFLAYVLGCINEWAESKKLNKFFIVGHSGGAFLAHQFARMYPDKVAKAVLINPGLFDDSISMYLFGAGIHVPFNKLLQIPLLGTLGFSIGWAMAFSRTCFSQPAWNPFMKEYHYLTFALAPPVLREIGKKMCVVSLKDAEVKLVKTIRSELATTTVPVALICGEDDPLLPSKERMASAIREAQMAGHSVDLIPNCAHCPMLEVSDLCANLLTDRLSL